jgi:hypothetical protein
MDIEKSDDMVQAEHIESRSPKDASINDKTSTEYQAPREERVTAKAWLCVFVSYP